MTKTSNRICFVLLLALLVTTAHAGRSDTVNRSSQGGAVATFWVGSDTFTVRITDPEAIEDAIALWQGWSSKRIPIGRLSCTPDDLNYPWNWHLIPSTVGFAETTFEVCDGLPSYVEENCPGFGAGYYCPWGAFMISLMDCRGDAGCTWIPW